MADYDQLSALGVRQAEAVGVFLQQRGLAFDRVLVGPRRRQLDTARAVLQRLEHPVAPQHEPALDEFAEGSQVLRQLAPRSAEAGNPVPVERADQLKAYSALLAAWASGDVAIDGAPSAAAFFARVSAWLGRLAAEPVRGQRVLAVTSAGVIGVAGCAALGLGPDKLMALMGVLRNASLSEIVYSRGRTSLLAFNGVAHLAPELVTSM